MGHGADGGRTEGTRSWDAPAGWPARHSTMEHGIELLDEKSVTNNVEQN